MTLSRPFIALGSYIQKQTGNVSLVSKSKQELLNEINILKEENEVLVLRNNELSQDKALIEEFKNSFGVIDAVRELQFAHIISKPNQSVYDTLLLSVGEEAGVVIGKPVYVNKYSVIGVVDHVEKNTSVVLLFSSPGQKTFARLERTGYDVTLIGRGGGNMIVEVPKEIETALGDRLVYPLLDNKMIGIIRDITMDDRDANKKLYITLPTNMLTLDHVYIQK